MKKMKNKEQFEQNMKSIKENIYNDFNNLI